MRPAFRPRPVVPGAPPVIDELPVEIASGPPIARAPNDVGGLLDTSKGWTLAIPDPRETAVASAAVISSQKQSPLPNSAMPEPAGPALIAAR
jgi:hypothetical protein